MFALPAAASAAAGDPDTSFSGDGRVTHGLGQSTIQLRDLGEDAVRQTDGKIVIVGLSGEDASGPATVTRLNADGTLDTGFSTDGFAPIDLQNSTANAVALQSDGKIVVAGSTFSPGGSQDGFVARLESNGTLDVGFNGDGIATFDAGGGAFDSFMDLAIAADGDAIAVGSTFTPGPTPPAGLVVRFDGSTGDPDAAFGGGDGIVTTTDVTPFTSLAVAAQGNDVILAGPSSGQTKVLRLLANGNADSTFGTGGSTTLNFGGGTSSTGPATNGLAIAPSGKIVVGALVNASGEDFGVARLSAGGAPDTGFAGDGTVTSNLGASDQLKGIAVQADDSVLAVGRTGTTPQFADADFAIARYTASGVLDNGFDGDGFAVTDLGEADTASAVVIDPGTMANDPADDHAIATGNKGTLQSGADLAAARYATATGALDTTFGDLGVAVHGHELVRNSNEIALGVAVQDDGKVVVAGNTDFPDGNSDFQVTRFNANGTVDTGFAGDGTAEVDFSGGSDSANDVAVLDDGSIVAFGGTMDPGTGAGDLAVARLTPAGALDGSFGTGGLKTVDLGSTMGPEIPGGLVVQIDDKLVLSGNFNAMSGSGIAAVRLDTDGAEDTTFDGDGIAPLTVPGTFLQASSVAIQADGKIVVGGALQVFTPSFGADTAVARFTDTGAADTSFSADGIATIDVGPSTFDASNDVVIAGDGDIVTVGSANPTGTNGEIGFASFDDVNGSPDAGFGSGGQLTLTSPAEDFGGGIGLQADGKLVASGNDAGDFASIRLSAAGVPDTSYGPGGRRTLDLGEEDTAAELAVMPDRRLVLAGNASDGPASDIAVARLLGDPPGTPSVTTVSPVGPADDNNPELTGTADAGTTVRIYDNAACSGAEVGSGSQSAFLGVGITAFVPDDTTTTFYATASDANGSSACSAAGPTYQEVTPGPNEGASGSASPGGTVSTNEAVDPSDPVGTEVTAPSGGAITITEQATSTPTPSGFSLLGQQVEITAPAESAANPLVLVFHVDASLLPSGVNETNLQIFRNGTVVADCAPGAGSSATPDPCVAGRANAGGDVTLTVRTSQASSWNFGVASGSTGGGGSGAGAGTGSTTTTPTCKKGQKLKNGRCVKKKKKKKKKK